MIWLIILCTILCLLEFSIKRKILTPTFLFNFIWAITLGLYNLQLSKLQHDISKRTTIVFLICIISYNVASMLYSFLRKRNTIEKETESKSEINYNIVDKRMKIAKVIAILIFIVEIIYSRGVPLIWYIQGADKIYFDFGISSLNGALYGLITLLGT